MSTDINSIRRKIMRALTGHIGPVQKISLDFKSAESISRILIVRPNSRLGNQLMLTPLLQRIENTYPDCKVDLFVRGNLAPVLFQNYPNIDRFIRLPSRPFKQLGKYFMAWLHLQKHQYDLVFNVDASSSSGRLCTKWVRGKVKFFGSPELVSTSNPDAVHMAKTPVYNFDWLIEQMNFSLGEKHLEPESLCLRLTDNELAEGKKVLKSIVKNDKPTIMFYTYATGNKCLSNKWWQELYAELQSRYGENYNLLEVLPKENVSQINFVGLNYYSTNLREMGAVISLASVFITGDCGVMHLASSVGVPTIALFSRDNIAIYEPYNRGSQAFHIDHVKIGNLMRSLDHILLKKVLSIVTAFYSELFYILS